MYKKAVVALMCVFLLTGAAFSRISVRVGVVVPALPAVVELDNGNSYYQNGYYYSYRGNVWYYSRHKNGGWKHLQRSRYPHEVHYRNQDQGVHGEVHGDVQSMPHHDDQR